MRSRWGSVVRRSTILSALLVAAAVAFGPGTASAARGIDLGFAEPRFNSTDGGVRDFWLDRAVDSGSQWVRVGVGWRGIAPNQPANPTDPADPAYFWGGPDDAIRDAAARGQKIIVTVSSAPAWAEGPGRDPGADPGTWKPDPGKLKQFAIALAKRYSGTFADPLHAGKVLPRVSDFEGWNESNLSAFLTPQRVDGKLVSDDHYKLMLNAFYAGVHSVQPKANVIAGALSPIGSDGGNGKRTRTGPLEFLRGFLCLKGRKLKKARCPVVAKFDTLSHHPINVDRKPLAKAGRDDAGIAEMDELTKMLRKAERSGRAAGARRHPVWNTEFWWNSKPPKKGRKTPSLKQQANYIQEALYILWKEKVGLAMLYQVGDQPGLSFQSGIYFKNGKPKPSQTAFRFPLVGDRKSKRKVLVWGRAPDGGKVKIQVKKGRHGRFKTQRKKRVRAGDVFKTRVKLKGKGKLRAKLGREKSLSWKQGRK